MKFKVEVVLQTETAVRVVARVLELGDFSVSSSSRLGGILLQLSLSQPCAFKSDGTPDYDIFVFTLADREHADLFSADQVVELDL